MSTIDKLAALVNAERPDPNNRYVPGEGMSCLVSRSVYESKDNGSWREFGLALQWRNKNGGTINLFYPERRGQFKVIIPFRYERPKED